MKTFKKNYIGKGIQVPNMSITKVTVKVSELLKHVHEFGGEQYCTFEVAKLQQPDDFNRTHTAYCTTVEEVPDDNSKKPSEKSTKK
ncbi:hypothetical protein [Draconibacterium halophilum]|uniref:Uncharacterized protein n=1 Tax=Draconibacterium halophilum TaxID=2706887 RepID=A0A6C0RBH6_9BACT|nr:hypothetical protein [Draconibacterium halophilum]QIA07125.1 hypothetical protein G0Q07_05000 [Draconibacterium halophilum]